MHDDEVAIRRLVATWLEASKAGDTATVLGLMAEDVVFLTPGQPPMRGRSTFAAAQTELRQFDLEATSRIDEIQVRGDWAWAWTTLTVVVTPKSDGPSVKRSGNTLSILEKRAGSWVILRDANMLAVVPQS